MSDGGLIVLLATNEETEVNEAYQKIVNNFDWAGDETSLRVSEIQHLFISKNKKTDPYVQFKFVNDVMKEPTLQKSAEYLQKWFENDDNRQRILKALNHFVETFQAEINRVYTAWET
jgi:hypothetical protein